LQKLHDNYDEMGLVSPPSVYDKSTIYVSPSPLRALSERCTWLSRSPNNDDYGKVLLRRGVPEEQILEWFTDPMVKLPKAAAVTVGSEAVAKGKSVKLSSIIEDKDTSQCTALLVGLYDTTLFGPSQEAGCHCTIS